MKHNVTIKEKIYTPTGTGINAGLMLIGSIKSSNSVIDQLTKVNFTFKVPN